MEALTRAAEVRTQRARIKAALKAGEANPVEALGDPVMGKVPVSEFLRSLPGIGEKRCKRMMRMLGISSRKRVGGLGRNQREALVAYMEMKYVD